MFNVLQKLKEDLAAAGCVPARPLIKISLLVANGSIFTEPRDGSARSFVATGSGACMGVVK